MSIKKSEKIIGAVLVMVFGLLLIIMKARFIGVLMTVAGISLILLGVVDIFCKRIPPAIVKIVAGGLVILCGWVAIHALLYIFSAVLLVLGGLLLYDKIKKGTKCTLLPYIVWEYAKVGLCILLGLFLLFHREWTLAVVFNVSGVLVLVEGGVLLLDTFSDEER